MRFGTIARAAVCSAALCAACAPAGAAPALVAVHYAIHPLAMPPGMVLAQRGIMQNGPREIALAENGAVAAIVAGTTQRYAAHRIVVWRSNGSRITIGLPDDDVLHRAFRHYSGGPKPYPDASFAHVVLAAEGTPFATIESPFSGAYSGSDKGIFRWTGTRWTIVRASGASYPTGTPPDFDVAAAELPRLRVGMTASYSSAIWNVDAMRADPAYHQPEAWLHDGIVMRKLGMGTMTSLAGRYASGFVEDRGARTTHGGASDETPVPYATLWHDGTAARLGRGVAFGVNAFGVAVGDDRMSANGSTTVTTRTAAGIETAMRHGDPDGRPMRWDAHGAVPLARASGTAFSIAPDGSIVGTFARGGGFVSRGGSAIPLAALVRNGRVLGAYAINARGRILVLTGSAAAPRVAYADPVR